MMELLSPAPSPEAAVAAVQNGADAIYLGFSELTGCRDAVNFSDAAFEDTVRYCHTRGCRVYLAMDILLHDGDLPRAAGLAIRAQRAGVDAVLVRDMGLQRILRTLLPEMPLFAAPELGFRTAEDVTLAGRLGFRRVFLPTEVDVEDVRALSGLGVELAVMVQGRLCAAVRGLCTLSVQNGRGSADRGECARNCREHFSLGGRWDSTPLSYKDRCLLRSLDALEEAGVDCVYIGDRDRRPEYTAAFTALYARAVHEKKLPARADLDTLERYFSEYGFSRTVEIAGEKAEVNGRELESYCSTLRKSYARSAEDRRVSVQFAVLGRGDHSRIRLGVMDREGNRAAVDGPMPVCYGDVELKAESLRTVLYKTSGTPYRCGGVHVRDGEGLAVSAVELEMARRDVLQKLSEVRAGRTRRREGSFPPAPNGVGTAGEPVFNFRFRLGDQMSREMAALRPGCVYAPLELLAREPGLLEPFAAQGSVGVAVLPPVVGSAREIEEVDALLEKVRARGVYQVLAPHLGLGLHALGRGMQLRAGEEMQLFNGYALENLARAGFRSAVLSDQLSFAQISAMPKPLPTEAVIYGRRLAMVTENCLIKASAGRCACSTPGQMADSRGGVWPVLKEFGCRNAVYGSKKLFLADRSEDYGRCGLWAVQLSFTTESPRECLEVARSYMEGSGYRPNGLTRGEYYKGVR